MEIEIQSTQIVPYAAELAPGWKAVAVIPDPLNGTPFVPVSLFFRNGERLFDPKSLQNVQLRSEHLPHHHKSKPVDRLCKACRTSYGLAGQDAKALAKWIKADGHLTLYYRERGFEFENEPRFGVTLTLGTFNAVWHGKEEELRGALVQQRMPSAKSA